MDKPEQRARERGEAKGWSEEKIQRRTKIRRGARKFFTFFGKMLADSAVGIASVVIKESAGVVAAKLQRKK